jgi:hypothetical protein
MRLQLLAPLLLGVSVSVAAGTPIVPVQDWLMFGGDLPSTSANPQPAGITAANVSQLSHRRITLDGVVDASALYLHAARVGGAPRNAIFVTSSYGKTIALDAASGEVLWEYTPPSYRSLAGTRQFTNSTPVADTNRQSIYAASPDGYMQRLAVSDGHPLWRTSITKLPRREKMDSPLKFLDGHVIAVTAGYIGDAPPYQGHVVILDGGSGKILQVWNSLCSNRTELMDPSSCPQSDSAIWGRAGAVIDPSNGDILIATGNGDWNGTTDWGDAVIELNAGATEMLGNYTPTNTQELNEDDLDLGSTSPALLTADLVAQGGKDGKIRLLSRQAMSGSTPHQDHELQIVPTPSGARLFAQPAVWRRGGAQLQIWLFAADSGATAAWELDHGKLVGRWRHATSGTSPFVADDLLFVYALDGGRNVYEAASGKLITTLPCGPGHWNSPIVVNGTIILPEGDANRRAASGVLNVWSVARGR